MIWILHWVMIRSKWLLLQMKRRFLESLLFVLFFFSSTLFFYFFKETNFERQEGDAVDATSIECLRKEILLKKKTSREQKLNDNACNVQNLSIPFCMQTMNVSTTTFPVACLDLDAHREILSAALFPFILFFFLQSFLTSAAGWCINTFCISSEYIVRI